MPAIFRTLTHALSALFLLAPMGAQGQTQYDTAHMQREHLGRGLVALRQTDGRVALSWRILASDRPGEPFDVYRNGVKLNKKPLTTGGSFFVDNHPTGADALYKVMGGRVNGTFRLKANAPAGYLAIPLDKPVSNMTHRDGRNVEYIANDAAIGDVDGDGEYEIVLKWDPNNSADNSRAGITERTLFDCYRLDGTRLWRIDMGPNIRSGAHYVPFIFYDLDGDQRAELMVKTADGTRDGLGRVLGDSTRIWRSDEPGSRFGRIMDGPERLTVFSGATGEALATVDYNPPRGPLRSWGDDHGNRSERYLAALAWLDGRRPSAVFCRGYYTRTVLAAWNWDGHELSQHWVFDTNNPQWADYAGQGNHNLRVADVDGDGCDEIVYGAMCVDHDGNGLYNTRMGHGDALHLVADPADDKLYVWNVHENRRDGSELHDAATGEIIFQKKANFDVGRGMAADIDSTNYGVELWSANTRGLLNMKGEPVRPASEASGEIDYSNWQRPPRRLSCNFSVWWDGDLTRELLDHERVTKYNPATGECDELIRFDGRFNNSTKSNPCLSADILGDWREEVLVRNANSTELRLYVSTIPTPYRINCLEEDPTYRASVANENVGYNQPPETGFYLGPDGKRKFLK